MPNDHGIELRQIGTIRSPYTPETDTPRQGRHAPDTESRIVLDAQYEAALQDLESFSHVIVLYAFDGTPVLDLKPYLPGVDCIEDATEGWTKELDRRPGSAGD